MAHIRHNQNLAAHVAASRTHRTLQPATIMRRPAPVLLLFSAAGQGVEDEASRPVEILFIAGGRTRIFQGIHGADGRVTVNAPEYSQVSVQSLLLPDRQPDADAISELEDLVNSEAAHEADFQRFMERHPQVLLGGDYEALIPHVVLARDGDDNLIPDFFLKPVEGMSHEPAIVDLKLPDLALIKPTPRREGLYAKAMDGVNQLRTYGAYFEDRKNRDLVKSTLGFTAYRPRLILVGGRNTSSVSPEVRARVLADIRPVELRTYEDLLHRMKRQADSPPAVPTTS